MAETQLQSSAPHIVGAHDYAELVDMLAACSGDAPQHFDGVLQHG